MTSSTKPVILLDEGLPFGLEVFLKDDGWQTEKVAPGTKDTDIVLLAREKGFIVITQDKQLAARLKAQRVKVIGIGVEDILPIVQDRLNKIL